MAWAYVERERFVRSCDKNAVSERTREAIRSWAPSVGRSPTPRLKIIYRSPKNRFELWAVGIPNPESNKGKSGGYRVVYFLDLTQKTINLDYIAERSDLGFKDEGPRRKDAYNDYIEEMKKYLKRSDE
jgi:mRNA-degrading endonuclease RelE of RelBE toxin-antitoxin system